MSETRIGQSGESKADYIGSLYTIPSDFDFNKRKINIDIDSQSIDFLAKATIYDSYVLVGFFVPKDNQMTLKIRARISLPSDYLPEVTKPEDIQKTLELMESLRIDEVMQQLELEEPTQDALMDIDDGLLENLYVLVSYYKRFVNAQIIDINEFMEFYKKNMIANNPNIDGYLHRTLTEQVIADKKEELTGTEKVIGFSFMKDQWVNRSGKNKKMFPMNAIGHAFFAFQKDLTEGELETVKRDQCNNLNRSMPQDFFDPLVKALQPLINERRKHLAGDRKQSNYGFFLEVKIEDMLHNTMNFEHEKFWENLCDLPKDRRDNFILKKLIENFFIALRYQAFRDPKRSKEMFKTLQLGFDEFKNSSLLTLDIELFLQDPFAHNPIDERFIEWSEDIFEQQQTVFHLAAANPNGNEALKLIFSFSTAEEHLTAKDLNGTTPLLYACKTGHVDSVQLLLEQMPSLDLRYTDKLGNNAFTYAYFNKLDPTNNILKYLLKKDIEMLNKISAWQENKIDATKDPVLQNMIFFKDILFKAADAVRKEHHELKFFDKDKKDESSIPTLPTSRPK